MHLSHNIAHKVRVADRAKICEDFKLVYRAEILEKGEAALQTFVEKYSLFTQNS
ncbi:transposase [Litoribacterium kuwaitense]|uniref:transposase n=1 Tax=Litoribacterium kuwaitense TaxID=1398745 RepID=UPI0035E42F46